MSRKIARITQEKKLLLANEVVESNAKTSLNSDGRLEVDEIIEYPAELEGGRNLIRNGNFSKGLTNWANQGYSLSVVDGVLIAKNVSGTGTRFYYDIIQMPVDETYTISFEAKADKDNSEIFLGQGASTSSIGTISLTPDWKRYSITFQSINNYTISFHLSEPDVDYYFTNIKLEKGSQATPWTPAPEDLGLNYPDSIQNFNSSISGNNIITPEFIEGYPFVKPVIDDSLVLWLDGSTGNNYEKTNIWKDLSGNGNDGQLMNFDFTEDSGWVDGGLRFDGVKRKDYVLFSKEMLVQGCSFSIDFWTKLSGIGTNCFFCTRTVLGGGVAILALSDNKIRFDTGRGYQWQTSYGIPTNELVNIVVTKDDNYKKLYVNGKPYSSTGTVGDMSNLSNVSTIGASQIDNQSYDNFLKGDIYSFRIYNRALTDEEILQNYQAGQCSPLLAMRGD